MRKWKAMANILVSFSGLPHLWGNGTPGRDTRHKKKTDHSMGFLYGSLNECTRGRGHLFSLKSHAGAILCRSLITNTHPPTKLDIVLFNVVDHSTIWCAPILLLCHTRIHTIYFGSIYFDCAPCASCILFIWSTLIQWMEDKAKRQRK